MGITGYLPTCGNENCNWRVNCTSVCVTEPAAQKGKIFCTYILKVILKLPSKRLCKHAHECCVIISVCVNVHVNSYTNMNFQ